MRPSKAQDERAQIHIFEMITLFWLFFMSALFVLRIHVPDPPTAAYDGTLAGAGEDAIRLALADEGGNDSTFIEALRIGDLDAACTDLQDGIPVVTVEANCWLTRNSASSAPYGLVGTPSGSTVTVHRLVQIDDVLWTISISTWYRGGGV